MSRTDYGTNNRFILVLIISAVSLLVSSGLLQLSVFSSLKNKIYDSLFYFRGPKPSAEKNVVIVAIDEASLQKIGDWPWPRSILAELIKKIKQGDPQVIGIDLLLDLPAKGPNGRQEDAALALAFSEGPVCVLPVVLDEKVSGGFQETLFKPLDLFMTAHTVPGVVNVVSDPADKISREFQGLFNGTNPSFPLAVCLAYLGYSPDDIRLRKTDISFGPWKIPAQDNRSLINYTCANIDSFSAGDVMEPFFDPGFFFKGKAVLLGRTDIASKDFVNTPVPSKRIFETLPMAGVEVWEEVIDMVLRRNFLYRVPPLPVFLCAVFFSIVICVLTLRAPKTGALVTFLCSAVCGFVFYFLFFRKNIVLPVFYLVSVCAISYGVSFLYTFIVTHREKKMITTAFKSYISPHILQSILSQKVDLRVGGKKKKLTILFTDIKGFTSFSDTHGPDEVLNFLKAFFPEMNKVIMDHNGLIDKLLGDGILAFFGDFTDSDSHAIDAVRAAIEMQRKVPELQKRLGFDFQIRIGINTGEVTVGNIGSREHLDYTVIGSNVNLAQRLESNCEPGKILISESTYQMVRNDIEAIDTREIPLKGFSNPVKICTVDPLKHNT